MKNKMVLPESSGDEEENKQHKFYKEFAKVTKCDRDEDASDEDLEIMDSQTEVCTTCPITRLEMKDPLRSTKCGHSYSKAGITQWLQGRASRKCPIPGCNAVISMADLEADDDIELAQERNQRREKVRYTSVVDDME